MPDLPGFGLLDMKPKFLRQNSIVKDQGMLCSAQSDILDRSTSETRYL